MTDVCLVCMPYAAIEHPSLALGILKASLTEKGIDSVAVYPNLWFAEDIGLYKYSLVSAALVGTLLGEWTFAKAAFPEFDPDEQAYFRLTGYDRPDRVKEILDIRRRTPAFIERSARKILEYSPKIVSCSSTFHQHCASLAVLRRIRELAPEVVTIVGGAHCEGPMGLATVRLFPWVDFTFSGEGDEGFAQLCDRILKKGRDLAPNEVPYGALSAYHRSSDLTGEEAPRVSIDNLDTVPVPDFDDYFEQLQTTSIARYISPGLPVETSRGCWWGQKQHCTFCGLNGQGMTYRSKSPDRVVSEFSQLSKRYAIDKFFVVDNIIDLEHINTVMPIFASLEKPYNIFYETKANLKREQVKQLAEAGVRWLQPGIESLNDNALELMRKGTTAITNVQLMKWVREFGIYISWNFLADIPGEERNWYRSTLEWLPLIVHLQPPPGIGTIRPDRFSVYQQNPDEHGLKLIPNRVYSFIYPYSREEIEDLVYYFEDEIREKEGKVLPGFAAALESALAPEHIEIKQLIEEWNSQFYGKTPPMLSVAAQESGELKLTDTRLCAIESQMVLDGLAARIYTLCDRARSLREILGQLRVQDGDRVSENEVSIVLQELKVKRVLLHLGDRYLALAVREPFPKLLPTEVQPFGYANLRAYIQDTRNPFWNPSNVA